MAALQETALPQENNSSAFPQYRDTVTVSTPYPSHYHPSSQPSSDSAKSEGISAEEFLKVAKEIRGLITKQAKSEPKTENNSNENDLLNLISSSLDGIGELYAKMNKQMLGPLCIYLGILWKLFVLYIYWIIKCHHKVYFYSIYIKYKIYTVRHLRQ